MRIAADTGALFELVWAAPLAALAVTITWGLVIWGSARAGEARRGGRSGLATLHLGVAAVGAVLFIAAVAFGLIVMASKD